MIIHLPAQDYKLHNFPIYEKIYKNIFLQYPIDGYFHTFFGTFYAIIDYVADRVCSELFGLSLCPQG